MPTGPRHGPVDAVPERSGDDSQGARDDAPATAEPVQGVQNGVAPRQEPPFFVQEDDRPRGARAAAVVPEPGRGRLASERREAEPGPVPVAAGEEGDAAVAEAAAAVVEDEVGHGGSVGQEGGGGEGRRGAGKEPPGRVFRSAAC